MKRLVLILFAISMFLTFSAYATEFFSTSTYAACPDWDLFCPGWTPKDQLNKNNVAFLEKTIKESSLNLDTCNAECVEAYDNAGKNVLSAFAKKNKLPVDLVVKAYMAIWDKRASEADVLLGVGKWDMQDTFVWANDFADSLSANHPYVFFGKQVCVAQEYGGTCPGHY